MTEQFKEQYRGIIKSIIGLMIMFLTLLLPIVSFGESVLKVGVIYPDVREPYITIFKTIISGIEAELEAQVSQYLINDETELPALEEWIKTEQINSVVALGNSGLTMSQLLGAEYNKVIGAVMITSRQGNSKLNVISMAPDPFRLFSKLKELSPGVKRVCVVYNPETQDWLIEQASQAAERLSITFHAEAAKNTRDAAVLYREMLKKQHSGVDAVWLLQGDTALKERSILYMVLKEAWDNNLLVFSSNPSHVPKGALFSLYPDNQSLGKSLAASVIKLARGEEIGLQPLSDLLTAVNVRTAEHLDLNMSRTQRREFDMIFPTR